MPLNNWFIVLKKFKPQLLPELDMVTSQNTASQTENEISLNSEGVVKKDYNMFTENLGLIYASNIFVW